MGFDAHTVELIRRAAPLHDIGKIGVPDAILFKPGKLNERETARMQAHTTIGSQLLGRGESSVIRKVAMEPVFLHHLQSRLGIRGVRRVSMHEPLTNIRRVIFVQLERGVPRTEVDGKIGPALMRIDDFGLGADSEQRQAYEQALRAGADDQAAVVLADAGALHCRSGDDEGLHRGQQLDRCLWVNGPGELGRRRDLLGQQTRHIDADDATLTAGRGMA